MYFIDYSIYRSIIDIIGNSPIESGGIIGIKNNTVCSFYFDCFAKHNDSSYTPSINILNDIIKEWKKEEIDFIGIVHSHPNGYKLPSKNDTLYARMLLDTNENLPFVIFPIVTMDDEEIFIFFYKYDKEFSRIKLTLKNRHC